MSEEHAVWTVDSTAYLRNLEPEDLQGECIAIHHQSPPKHNEETGATGYSLRFPTLIVSLYCAEPRAVADRVAAILNKHWNEDTPQ